MKEAASVKCTACEKENPQDAQFCGGCGGKLAAENSLTFDLATAGVPAASPASAGDSVTPSAPAGDGAAASGSAPPLDYDWHDRPAAPPSGGTPPASSASSAALSGNGKAQAAPPQSAQPTAAHTAAPGAQTAAPPASLFLVCLAGPDQGKRLAVGPQEVTLGRSVQCGLLSDDPDVDENHVALLAQNGVLHFRTLTGGFVFVDGAGYATGMLTPANQIRIGRSFWQIEMLGARATASVSLFDRVGERVSAVTGVSHVEGFKPQEMFSSVLEKRTDEDVEEYFLVGTRTTTPDLKDVSTTWPKPWVFFRAFTFSLLVYLGFYLAWNQFQNLNMLPGLMMMGAFAIPISVVIFYFEMNTPRNVSLYQVFKLMLTGGILSLIATLFIDTILRGGTGNIIAAMLTGVAEETAKVLALLLVVNKLKYRWTLNGLLLGGAVGAGFAGFESAGYFFNALWQTHSDTVMFQTIQLRGLLAPGGHVAWAALCGAALWKVKGNDRFTFAMFQDIRFLRVFGLAIVLHGLWDTYIPLPFYLTQIALSGIAWIAILSFVQDGLKQVQAAQAEQKSGGNYETVS